MIESLSIICSLVIIIGIYDSQKYYFYKFKFGEWLALFVGCICIFVGVYSIFYMIGEFSK